eukprot:1158867-Pelagomonas_calceolata.AAC.30
MVRLQQGNLSCGAKRAGNEQVFETNGMSRGVQKSRGNLTLWLQALGCCDRAHLQRMMHTVALTGDLSADREWDVLRTKGWPAHCIREWLVYKKSASRVFGIWGGQHCSSDVDVLIVLTTLA